MPDSLTRLIETVHRLRAPGGCPWDRKQTHQSLRQYLIEEAYEVLDVLDRVEKDEDVLREDIRSSLKEELGDLLMQVLLHSEMTRERGAFDIHDVAEGLNEKLIRRHPHVFGEEKADSAESAVSNWEKQKAKEKADQKKQATGASLDPSILDGVPRGLPALQRAARVIEKVTRVGFQWKGMEGPIGKVDEELAELKAEIAKLEKVEGSSGTPNSPNLGEAERIRERIAHELGDLFFTLANVAYLLKISPEDSLRGMLARFESRFKHVEKSILAQGKALDQSTLEEMDRYWQEAKRSERAAQ